MKKFIPTLAAIIMIALFLSSCDSNSRGNMLADSMNEEASLEQTSTETQMDTGTYIFKHAWLSDSQETQNDSSTGNTYPVHSYKATVNMQDSSGVTYRMKIYEVAIKKPDQALITRQDSLEFLERKKFDENGLANAKDVIRMMQTSEITNLRFHYLDNTFYIRKSNSQSLMMSAKFDKIIQ